MKEKGKQTQASLSSLCYTFYLFCASISHVSSIVMISVKDEYDNYLELITSQHHPGAWRDGLVNQSLAAQA